MGEKKGGKDWIRGQKSWEGLRLPTHMNHEHKSTINTYFTYCNYPDTSYILYVATFFEDQKDLILFLAISATFLKGQEQASNFSTQL